MKEFISLMNAQTFYYLWMNKNTRGYLLEVIENILKVKNNYRLLDTYNYQRLHIRSYIFLETKNTIYLLDFNHSHKINKAKMNKEIMNFLKYTTKKKTQLILICNYKGKNKIKDNIYYFYRSRANHDCLRLLMSKSYKEQLKFDNYGITDYLYNLGDGFYQNYLTEIENEETIYKLLDL